MLQGITECYFKFHAGYWDKAVHMSSLSLVHKVNQTLIYVSGPWHLCHVHVAAALWSGARWEWSAYYSAHLNLPMLHCSQHGLQNKPSTDINNTLTANKCELQNGWHERTCVWRDPSTDTCHWALTGDLQMICNHYPIRLSYWNDSATCTWCACPYRLSEIMAIHILRQVPRPWIEELRWLKIKRFECEGLHGAWF